MLKDRERLYSPVPVVNCDAPFVKGNARTDYNAGLFLDRSNPLQATSLDRLQQLFREIGNYFEPGDSAHMHVVDFEDTFNIPWVVTAKGSNGKVLVSYHVRLKRPDSTLEYAVLSRKKPEFYDRDYSNSSWTKSRTQIDGLPVYLGVEELRIVKAEDAVAGMPSLDAAISAVRIFTHGEQAPQQLRIVDENMVSLQHASPFTGTWRERWHFTETYERHRLDRVEVTLKGNWNVSPNA